MVPSVTVSEDEAAGPSRKGIATMPRCGQRRAIVCPRLVGVTPLVGCTGEKQVEALES